MEKSCNVKPLIERNRRRKYTNIKKKMIKNERT
jgi:hypothetical protein